MTLKTTECSHSEAYCWMNCLELPTSCPQSPVECINKDSKPCCTDTITEDCANMDQSCRWECAASNHTTDDRFCNGQGTDMYMQGFTVSFPPCLSFIVSLCCSRPVGMGRMPALFCCSRAGFWTQGLSLVSPVLELFYWVGLSYGWVWGFIECLGIAIEGLLCLRREIQSRKILLRIRGLARRGGFYHQGFLHHLSF